MQFQNYLEFADTVSNGNKFVSTPHKSVHFNFLNFLEHVVHVGFIVPRFAIKQDWGLGDKGGFLGFFGSIGVQPVLTNFGSGLILLFFLIRTEKINVIIVVVSSSSGSWKKIFLKISFEVKMAFFQKGPMPLSFLQTDEPNYFSELDFWFFFSF